MPLANFELVVPCFNVFFRGFAGEVSQAEQYPAGQIVKRAWVV